MLVQHGARVHELGHHLPVLMQPAPTDEPAADAPCALCLAFAPVGNFFDAEAPTFALLDGLAFARARVALPATVAGALPAARSRGPPRAG